MKEISRIEAVLLRAQRESEHAQIMMREMEKAKAEGWKVKKSEGRPFDIGAFIDSLPPEKWEELRLDHERAQGRKQAIAALRRARLKGAPEIEKVNRFVVFDRDKGICHICGKEADRGDFHLDHVVALARGGSHTYANLKVSHPICNSRKGAS